MKVKETAKVFVYVDGEGMQVDLMYNDEPMHYGYYKTLKTFVEGIKVLQDRGYEVIFK
jgi:hypothetical protein